MHVVAAVLQDEKGRVLVAQRPQGKRHAGAWEFPGGKLEPGEARLPGLARELEEELGIRIEVARPLIRYVHGYIESKVDLDVWSVTKWTGDLVGRECQALVWEDPARIIDLGLLPADAVVVDALLLPQLMLVTPPSARTGEQRFLDQLEIAARLASVICLRRPDLSPMELQELAAAAACRLEGAGTRLLLHGDPAQVLAPLLDPDSALHRRISNFVGGIHMPGRFLSTLQGRPVPDSMWLGVSCHDKDDLRSAVGVRADYAFLGPLKPTASHPGQPGMGWQKFEELVRDLPLPVYAIGGLGPEDLETAWAHGAQGIAAIRSLWPED